MIFMLALLWTFFCIFCAKKKLKGHIDGTNLVTQGIKRSLK